MGTTLDAPRIRDTRQTSRNRAGMVAAGDKPAATIPKGRDY